MLPYQLLKHSMAGQSFTWLHAKSCLVTCSVTATVPHIEQPAQGTGNQHHLVAASQYKLSWLFPLLGQSSSFTSPLPQVELPALLSVDLVHCEQAASEAVAAAGGKLQLLQGELVATSFFDTLAREIDEHLQVQAAACQLGCTMQDCLLSIAEERSMSTSDTAWQSLLCHVRMLTQVSAALDHCLCPAIYDHPSP